MTGGSGDVGGFLSWWLCGGCLFTVRGLLWGNCGSGDFVV